MIVINEETAKIEVTNFSHVMSLIIYSENKENIVTLGHIRWKIENKGFKEQESEVIKITRIYIKNCNGTTKYIFINSIC